MSKSRGEGRAASEKQQRVVTPAEVRTAQRERRKAEEAEWAAKNSPVVTKKPASG